MNKKNSEYKTYEQYMKDNFPELSKNRAKEKKKEEPENFGIQLARKSLEKVSKIMYR